MFIFLLAFLGSVLASASLFDKGIPFYQIFMHSVLNSIMGISFYVFLTDLANRRRL